MPGFIIAGEFLDERHRSHADIPSAYGAGHLTVRFFMVKKGLSHTR